MYSNGKFEVLLISLLRSQEYQFLSRMWLRRRIFFLNPVSGSHENETCMKNVPLVIPKFVIRRSDTQPEVMLLLQNNTSYKIKNTHRKYLTRPKNDEQLILVLFLFKTEYLQIRKMIVCPFHFSLYQKIILQNITA